MLHLLDTPHWQADGGEPAWVPATLPGGLLLYLAAQPRWHARVPLGELFWPEAEPARQRHQLRITLHRVRQMLAGWGAPPDALQTADHRVRLVLPTDLAPEPAAAAPTLAAPSGADPAPADAGVAKAQPRPDPAAFLHAYDLPAVPGFTAWLTAMRGPERASPAARSAVPGPTGAMAVHSPVAGGPPPPRPLHGREAEIHRLRAAALPAIVVLGEPGIGKTVLLDHAFPGSPCLHGREALAGLAYRPIVDALRAGGSALAVACRDPAHPLAPYRLDLARLLPELAPGEPLPPLDARTARSRLLDAFSEAFAGQAVLRVDDLQWCDEGTLEWLALLAHTARLPWRASMRLGFGDAPAARLVGRLEQAGLAETLQLGALAPAAARQLCAQVAPAAHWPEAWLVAVYRRSAGNPFALEQWALQRAAQQGDAGDGAEGVPPDEDLPERVARLVTVRLGRLPPASRAWVEASAVLGEPVPVALLGQVAGTASAHDEDLAAALLAQQAGLLRSVAGGRLDCAHDLVREATLSAMPAARRIACHRRAARALPGFAEQADPLRIAGHWLAAQAPQTALQWLYQAALKAKALGAFAEAEQLWARIAVESTDPALTLRARLGLGEARLNDDLPSGRALIQQVLDAVGVVADPRQRLEIEGRCLASLVDNAVFAGDMAQAGAWAQRLKPLLDRLGLEDRLHGLEVLVEYTMRQPALEEADAWVRQLELLAPEQAMTRSLRAQWHWVAGDIRAARDGFERLLVTHAEWARGQTLENDLGVMLHALGDLGRAEVMLRRSLQSWRGVRHTETLSNLALGAVLGSAGRFDEARQCLDEALAVARAQGSPLFEFEALVRLARVDWLQQRPEAARGLLAEAALHVQRIGSPLPLSQYLATVCVVAQALGQGPPAPLLDRLAALAEAMPHPLVRARWARARLADHLARGTPQPALAAAQAQAETALQAGLAEWRVEALAWVARLTEGDAAQAALREARDLAALHGLGAWWPALQAGSSA